MPTFVNILPGAPLPLYLDAENIAGFSIDPRDKMVSIFGRDGLIMRLDPKSWSFDLPEALRILSDQGFALIPLPLRLEHEERLNFISPRAVACIMMSEPGAGGIVGTEIRVRGMGLQETRGTAAKEVEALLAAVKSVNPNLVEWEPGAFHSPWGGQCRVCIDPAAVTNIRQFTNDVTVGLGKAGRLRLRLDSPPQKEGTALQPADIADRLAAGGKFAVLGDDTSSIYLKPEDIGFVRASATGKDFTLMVSPSAAASGAFDEIILYYPSEAARNAALAVLSTAPQGTAKPKKRAPSP